MNTTSTREFELRQEHKALQTEVKEWRQWWKELRELGDPRCGEMGERLAHFRDHLQSHFQHEEEVGPLAELSQQQSEVGAQTRHLWVEHVELLKEVDSIIERLKECGSQPVCWGDARELFERFLDRLVQHDAEEEQVLEVAQGRG